HPRPGPAGRARRPGGPEGPGRRRRARSRGTRPRTPRRTGARALRSGRAAGRRHAPPRTRARPRAGARPDRSLPGGVAHGELREADPRRRVHPAHRPPPGGGVMLAVATLWRREVVRFVRQRSRLLGALAQPLVFWLLLGGGLSPSFRPPGSPAGAGYLAFLYPGILALVLPFTAI